MMKQKTRMYPDPDANPSCPSFENDSEPAALSQPDKGISAKSRRLEEDTQLVRISAAGVSLEGNLEIPEGAAGIGLFAHGSGSGRRSPRNRYVAHMLCQG